MTTPIKPKEVNRQCPECEQDVKLTIDAETGDREGRCANCGLDVGAVVNRLRYAKAAKKVEEEGQPEKKKKDQSWW